VLAATVAWASAAVVMRRFVRGMHAGVITFYRFLVASVAFVVYAGLTSGIAIASVYQVLVGLVVGLRNHSLLRRIETGKDRAGSGP